VIKPTKGFRHRRMTPIRRHTGGADVERQRPYEGVLAVMMWKGGARMKVH
jgi:hypothetical protein